MVLFSCRCCRRQRWCCCCCKLCYWKFETCQDYLIRLCACVCVLRMCMRILFSVYIPGCTFAFAVWVFSILSRVCVRACRYERLLRCCCSSDAIVNSFSAFDSLYAHVLLFLILKRRQQQHYRHRSHFAWFVCIRMRIKYILLASIYFFALLQFFTRHFHFQYFFFLSFAVRLR